MAAGPGDVWWSEELGDNLHQIYKLEKAIKREEDKLEKDAQKMDDMFSEAMQEMEQHEAKFRRSRSLRQPLHDGPLDGPLEDMLRNFQLPTASTTDSRPAPVIDVSGTPSLDSATASAASTTRAQNSSRQNSSRVTPSTSVDGADQSVPEPHSSTADQTEDPHLSASGMTAARLNDDPLLSASLAGASRIEIVNDDPLLSASLAPLPRN